MGELTDILKKIVDGKDANEIYTVATVTAVNGVLIDAQPVDETAELKDIRLCAADDNKVFIVVPAVGSVVYIQLSSPNEGIVVGFSEVSEILLRGDSFGGLVKVSSLVGKLNAIESDLNTLKTAFASWVVVPSDGGSALKAITATWYGDQFTPTVVSDIENDKVKHG